MRSDFDGDHTSAVKKSLAAIAYQCALRNTDHGEAHSVPKMIPFSIRPYIRQPCTPQ